MADHAAAAPSSADMWIACPASVTMAAGRTRPSSIYASEGSAAHRVAEHLINGQKPPRKITVDGREFIAGKLMLDALEPYVGYVRALREQGCDVLIETRVTLGRSRGWVWGTADCIAWSGGRVHIVDLKFGKGVPVRPDTSQLKIYALGALEALAMVYDNRFEDVVLTVVQPRLDPQPQAVLVTVASLRDWQDDVLHPAIGRIVHGDVTESAGAHCRFCVRKGECRAFASYKASAAADIFDDGIDTLASHA